MQRMYYGYATVLISEYQFHEVDAWWKIDLSVEANIKYQWDIPKKNVISRHVRPPANASGIINPVLLILDWLPVEQRIQYLSYSSIFTRH